MPAPAVAELIACLAKVDEFEDTIVSSDDGKLKITVGDVYGSIQDSERMGERIIILRSDLMSVVAIRGLTTFPVPPSKIASQRSIHLQSHPFTNVERDMPFTAAQRRHLLASGFVLTSPRAATRNV